MPHVEALSLFPAEESVEETLLRGSLELGSKQNHALARDRDAEDDIVAALPDVNQRDKKVVEDPGGLPLIEATATAINLASFMQPNISSSAELPLVETHKPSSGLLVPASSIIEAESSGTSIPSKYPLQNSSVSFPTPADEEDEEPYPEINMESDTDEE
jgi:hypothetical protein